MTATSQIDICSNALILIGDSPLSSLSEDRPGATVASNLYGGTVKTLITKYRWNFATKKALLSRLTATPLNDWNYQFQLPTDFLLAIRIEHNHIYQIFEDKIYCNAESVSLDYMYKPSESFFPSYFTEALTYLLASKMAVPVTGEADRAEAYYKIYLREVAIARNIDAQQDTHSVVASNPFLEARSGY